MKRRQNRSSQPSLQAIEFPTTRQQNILFWRIPPNKITRAILFSHQNHRQKSRKCRLTFTNTVTRQSPEILAQHDQHRTVGDEWVKACAQTCARVLDQTCRRERSIEPLPTTMHGWNQEVDEQHTTLTHKKMSSVWWLVHQEYALFSQGSESKMHMHTECTWTHSRPQHTTIQQWAEVVFFSFTFCAWGS